MGSESVSQTSPVRDRNPARNCCQSWVSGECDAVAALGQAHSARPYQVQSADAEDSRIASAASNKIIDRMIKEVLIPYLLKVVGGS
jgi:hypothetical protein